MKMTPEESAAERKRIAAMEGAPNAHKWTGPYPAKRTSGVPWPYYECDNCGLCTSNPLDYIAANAACPA